MTPAYASEPVPLARNYPDSSKDSWEMSFQLAGIILLLGAFWALQSATIFFGSILQFLGRLAIPSILSLLFFWSSAYVGEWHTARLWRKAFMANNRDLDLDYEALDKVVAWLTHTRYSENFQTAAIYLASIIREPNPVETYSQYSQNWRIYQGYLHFAHGKCELPDLATEGVRRGV